MVRVWVATLVALMSLGCVSESDEVGFKSSNLVRMELIKKEMSARNIPFTEDGRGFVRYDKKYQSELDAIERELDNEQAVKYGDPAHVPVALAIMKEMGIKTRTEQRADGEWLVWAPKDAQQQREAESTINAAISASIQRIKGTPCNAPVHTTTSQETTKRC